VPYPPPGAAPHISEFKKVLEEEFGCEFKHVRFELGDGEVFDHHYIERDMGGGTPLVYPIDNYDEDMRVHGHLLLSICQYFQLDCSRWGITLTHWEDLPED